MSPTKLLVLDPLTLLGREFLGCADRLGHLGLDMDFRHTDVDDEHEIVDFADGPELVRPLETAADLADFDAIVVASDAQGSRHDHLLEHLDTNPETAVVDMGRLEMLVDRCEPSTGRVAPRSRWVRTAHTAFVVTERLLEVLEVFGAIRGAVAIESPVSTHGRDAIELLARQSAIRLQGGPVEEKIYGHIRAFNLIAEDAFHLQEEAATVLPQLPLAVTHSLSGVFHGHLAHIVIDFAGAVDPDHLRDALAQTDSVEVSSPPISLDTVPDLDTALITPPAFSPDRHTMALTAMADGLRIGGALTAIDILETLI
jgi:hypothetical protein